MIFPLFTTGTSTELLTPEDSCARSFKFPTFGRSPTFEPPPRHLIDRQPLLGHRTGSPRGLNIHSYPHTAHTLVSRCLVSTFGIVSIFGMVVNGVLLLFCLFFYFLSARGERIIPLPTPPPSPPLPLGLEVVPFAPIYRLKPRGTDVSTPGRQKTCRILAIRIGKSGMAASDSKQREESSGILAIQSVGLQT